jgi:preprotein translocase subunit SecA
LEAKEHVRIQSETQTLASISYQNYFRMYKVLAGMTGTADTEALEFKKIYNLDVLVIPTNQPMIRDDVNDIVYKTAKEKFLAIADEIETAHKRGQPVLVGTSSVEKSELLSMLLNKRQIPHEVLNAKNHAREAEIIKQAGQNGAVTIATNMAGRGTDIVLGEGVRELGGLYVLGTERNDSRRIDNQLRGRSGRQGDPGKSRFFLSLEDDLIRIFASDRMSALMQRNMKDGESIESGLLTRSIETAQKRVEEQHFSSRKHLLEYDDVMNQQRQVVYQRRRQALVGQGDVHFMEPAIETAVQTIALRHAPEQTGAGKWELETLAHEIHTELHAKVDLSKLNLEVVNAQAIAQEACEQIITGYRGKMAPLPQEIPPKIESYIYLQVIDTAWKEHLQAMDALKDSVSLRGYGQRDPLQEYKREAFVLFEAMIHRIEDDTSLALVRMPAPTLEAPPPKAAIQPVDEKKLSFSKPASEQIEQTKQARPTNSESAPPPASPPDDGMIYHGSRAVRRGPQERATPVAQTIRREAEKVGRNDPCPCGSGKKYKKCHGAAVGSTQDEDGVSP